MKLVNFRIKNFRSVQDSGDIETEDITVLIGENESGKTNILLPLWKLNPSTSNENSQLNLIKDFPRENL